MKMKDPAPGKDKRTRKKIVNQGLVNWRLALAEVKTLRFWRDVLCEALIVFYMVAMATMAAVPFGGNPQNIVAVGLAAGLYVFILIEAFGHIQMSCMNPSVIILFVVTKRLGFLKGIFYFLGQLAGSVAGAKLVYEVTPVALRAGVRPLALGVTPAAGVAVEWVLTSCLLFVVTGALDSDRRSLFMPGLPIGLTIALGILGAANYTGGCMNPVIVFGPAAVSGNWTHQWVYWAGGLGGGITAITLYHFFTYDGPPFDSPAQNNKPPVSDEEEKTAAIEGIPPPPPTTPPPPPPSTTTKILADIGDMEIMEPSPRQRMKIGMVPRL